MNGRRLAWILGVAVIILISLASIRIPFLWDTTYHSLVANAFYHSGFRDFLPPNTADNGNPILYPLLIALGWKVFGYSILSSHLFFALVLISLVFGTIRLATLLEVTSYLWLLPLLLMADPSLLAQSMLMGYDILLLSLQVWAMVCIIGKRSLPLAFIIPAILMLHTRGIVVVAFLFLIQIYLRQRSLKALYPYLAGAAVLVGWHLWHYFQRGWFIMPADVNSINADLYPEQWIRNAAYVLWRSLDLGRVGLWLITAILLIRHRHSLGYWDRTLLLFALLPLLLHIIAFSGGNLPVSQRYFLFSQLMVMILLLRNLRFLKPPSALISTFGVMLILISGHFWFYPQRFGNAWDSSLIFMPWVDLEPRLQQDIEEKGLNRAAIATEYPLTYAPADSKLNNDSIAFIDLSGDKPENNTFVLYSNYSNMFKPDDVEMMKQDWNRVMEWRKGRIELILFQNPENH